MTLQSARSSHRRPLLLCLIVAAAAAAHPAGAQQPDSVRAAHDSLVARLERAEAAIEMLRQQVAAQDESSVKAKSGMKLEWHGRILMNAFSNSRRTNNSDVPTTARADTANGLDQGGAGIEIRQTTLGLAVTAPKVLGAEFLGDLDLDFFGGQVATSGGRTMPVLRLRTARAILTWTHVQVLFGQEEPLVSNLNPVSLAGIGAPDFSAAGNLWYWIPQARLTVFTGGPTKIGLTGAILAPMTGDAVGAFDTDFDVAERSRRPNFEGRAFVRWGEGESEGEIGLGAHLGWFAPARDSLLESRGVMADALVPMGKFVEFRGEAFAGRGLRGLGGGQIAQLFGKNGVVVRGTGGWGQLNIRPSTRVTFGAGYGFDDPNDADLTASGRLKNVTSETHLIVRPGGPLVFSAEWRRTTTTFTARSWTNDHFNLGAGFEF